MCKYFFVEKKMNASTKEMHCEQLDITEDEMNLQILLIYNAFDRCIYFLILTPNCRQTDIIMT